MNHDPRNPEFGITWIELNRFAVGVVSAVASRTALLKHNRYMVSERY